MQQVTIGDVGIREPDAQRDTGMMGDERVRILGMFYRQETCRYVPCDLRRGEGYRELAWSEIRWDTAGPSVTGETA